MKAFKNLVLFIFFSVSIFIIICWYSGAFAKTTVEVKTTGPIVAVYQDFVGRYKQTASIQDSLYNALWDDGIENYQTLGIFPDDPKVTPPNQLRSMVGCVVEKTHINKVKKLSNKYKLFSLEQQTCAVVEFPYKNSFTIYAGVYKAYPKLKAFCTENNYIIGDIIEIYNIPKNITFIMPLKKAIWENPKP